MKRKDVASLLGDARTQALTPTMSVAGGVII
jgi:hypothetical protein